MIGVINHHQDTRFLIKIKKIIRFVSRVKKFGLPIASINQDESEITWNFVGKALSILSWVYTNGFWNFYSFFIDLKASPSYFLLCMMCKIQDTKKKSKPRKELYKISVFQLRHNLRQFSFSPEKLWSHEYNLTPTSGFTQKKFIHTT